MTPFEFAHSPCVHAASAIVVAASDVELAWTE
jgi:hypothetical protein